MRMLEITHTDAAVFPPTDLYNEGWMLRILLSLQSEGVDCFPFSFQPGARWFSEARVASPFLPRSRGDRLGETHTNVDGVVGHFTFQSGTKAGLVLIPDATQFVVIEAKMFSSLSPGTTHAPYYDQAARTVACMAWTIGQLDRSVGDLESLGFYVVAPEEQIAGGVFSAQVEKASIKEKVERRISGYANDDEKLAELQRWQKRYFVPTLEGIDVGCMSWESMIEKVDDASFRNFYHRCLRFNAQPP